MAEHRTQFDGASLGLKQSWSFPYRLWGRNSLKCLCSRRSSWRHLSEEDFYRPMYTKINGYGLGMSHDWDTHRSYFSIASFWSKTKAFVSAGMQTCISCRQVIWYEEDWQRFAWSPEIWAFIEWMHKRLSIFPCYPMLDQNYSFCIWWCTDISYTKIPIGWDTPDYKIIW